MATTTVNVKITAGRVRETVDAIGDTTGMVAIPSYPTILGGRCATVYEWYDELTNDGWEQNVITLHDWEL